MKRLLAACFLLCAAAAPASACLNDKELDTAEREFRSRYGEEDSAREPIELGFAPLGAVGLALIAGAYYVAGRRKSS